MRTNVFEVINEFWDLRTRFMALGETLILISHPDQPPLVQDREDGSLWCPIPGRLLQYH